MAENTIQITVDGTGQVNLDGLPASLAAAMRAATEYVQAKWIEAAQGGIGSLGPTSDVPYIQGIEAGAEYPCNGNFLIGRVTNYSPSAERVEHGFPSYDMKPGLLAGHQARRGKDGKLYNIVPFRWGTPRQNATEAGTGDQRATLKSMPDEIYAIVSQFKQSRRTGEDQVASINRNHPRHLERLAREDAPPEAYEAEATAMRRVYHYAWGDSLHLDDIPAQFRQPLKPWHQSSRFEGMYRFDAGQGTRATHSHYLTFRAVSEKSDPRAWIHPGAKGKPYSEEVVRAEAENVRQLVANLIAAGVGGPS